MEIIHVEIIERERERKGVWKNIDTVCPISLGGKKKNKYLKKPTHERGSNVSIIMTRLMQYGREGSFSSFQLDEKMDGSKRGG